MWTSLLMLLQSRRHLHTRSKHDIYFVMCQVCPIVLSLQMFPTVKTSPAFDLLYQFLGKQLVLENRYDWRSGQDPSRTQ